MNALKVAAANWKTTLAAFLAAVVAIAKAVMAMIDADPLTQPDWTLVVTLLIAAVGLFFARDADLTSTQLKLK